MKTKNIIIIAIIAVIIVAIGAYLMLPTTPQYKNITVNGITLEVPESNTTVLNQTEHYSIYNDTENGVAVFVFDSTNATLSDMSEATTFALTRDTFQVGAQIQEENGQQYNYSENLKSYTYLTNYTHKNVFVITKNKQDMLHILSTIKVEDTTITPDQTNNTTNTTVTLKTEKTNETGIKSESIKENLQEGDGSTYREVEYNDGNFRQYDSKGNLIGSSYDSDQAQLQEKYGDMT